MTMYESLKMLHISCAALSITGFFIRGVWMLMGSALLSAKPVKVIPHLVDSLLLLSALFMLYLSDWSVISDGWLQVKLLALLVYIALGMLAFRFARRKAYRFASWLLALLVFSYIVILALNKSVLIFVA